jgi:hypothetical protein
MADTESRINALEKRLNEHIVQFSTTIRDIRAEFQEERAARELMRAEFREQMFALREGIQTSIGRMGLDVSKINRRMEVELVEIKTLMSSVNAKLGRLEMDKT